MKDPNALTSPAVWCHWRTYTAIHPGYVPPVGFPDVHVTNYEALQMDLSLAQSQLAAHLRETAELRVEVGELLKRHKRYGDPRHGHQVLGLWDGDTKHPAGSVCKACQNWERLRELSD